MRQPEFNPVFAYTLMIVGAVAAPVAGFSASMWLLPSDGQAGMVMCCLLPFVVLGGGVGGFLIGQLLDYLRDCRKDPNARWRFSSLAIALIGLAGMTLFLVMGSLALCLFLWF